MSPVVGLTVGAKVEELQRKLADARTAVHGSDGRLKIASKDLRAAGEARAVAAEQATSANTTFEATGCCQMRARVRAPAASASVRIFVSVESGSPGTISKSTPARAIQAIDDHARPP